jgi:hypothetical protein
MHRCARSRAAARRLLLALHVPHAPAAASAARNRRRRGGTHPRALSDARKRTYRVRAPCARARLTWRLPTRRAAQLVVTVTGFQLYKDANEFYFAHECAPATHTHISAHPHIRNPAHTFFPLFRADASPRPAPLSLRSCRRCDGTGKLTCNKCRGYGYLKKGPDDNVKAFKAGGPDSDVSNIYLCPFCKGTGTLACFDCRGEAKRWPAQLNVQVRKPHFRCTHKHTKR